MATLTSIAGNASLRTILNLLPLNDVKVTIANRYNWWWINWSGESIQTRVTLLGDPLMGGVTGLADELKTINPEIKVGYYAGGLAYAHFIYAWWPWFTTDDLLHTSGGADAHIYTPPSQNTVMLNLNRAATRAKLINAWADWLTVHNIDGLFWDAVDPAQNASLTQTFPGLTSGGLEGATHTTAWWDGPIMTFLSEMRAKLSQIGKQVWWVGLGDNTFDATDPHEELMGRWGTGFLDVTDVAIFEYAPRMYADLTYFTEALTAIDLANRRQKGIWTYFQPRLLNTTDPLLIWTEGAQLRHWALATYLLTKSDYTHFGYSPYDLYSAFDDSDNDYVFDSVDWDLDIGDPVADRLTNVAGATTIYYRQYLRSNGKKVYAVVNPHQTLTGTFGVNGSYKDWHPTTGSAVTVSGSSYTVAAKTGLLLFEQ